MNFKLKFAILSLALSINVLAYSQSISGKIIDEDGSPVIAAVVILQNADSVYQATTTTDTSGYFKISSDVFPYILIIRHLVYEQKSVMDSAPDLGTIILHDKSNELGEIVVKDRKQVMQVADNGAMQFSAKLLALDKPVTTAVDLLDEVPLIQRRGDEYKVVGTLSEAVVILNGRKSQMTASQLRTMLESMPASQVKSIEVFFDTPPRYGVNGPSINVVLDKKRSDVISLRGDVFGTARQQYYFIGIAGTNLSLSGNNWSMYSTYRYSDGKYRDYDDLVSNHNVHDSVFHVSQSSNTINRGKTHSVTSLFEVDFKNEASLELQYSGTFYSGKIKTMADLLVDSMSVESLIKSPNKDVTNSFSFEFAKNELAIGGSFLHFNLDNDQDMENTDKSFIVSKAGQLVYDYDVYFDNVNEFSAGSLSYGFDADLSKTTNTFDEDVDGVSVFEKTKQKDVELSVYAGWSQSFEKASLNLSCELEYSKSDMKTDADTFNLWNNIAAIPDLSFMYRFDNENSINVSLTGEKIYPSYWDNNNSKTYENPYLSIDGNPELKPFVQYLLNAQYVIRDKYVIGAFGMHCPKYFAQILYMQSDTLQACYKYYNFDYSTTFGLMGTVPVDWSSRLSSEFSVTGLYDLQKGCCEDVAFDKKKLYAIFEMSTDFVLNSSKTLKGQISGWYQLPTIQGLYDMSAMGGLSARLNWTPNKRWNFEICCNDLFHNKYDMTVKQGTQDYKNCFKQYNTHVSLNVRYTFNEFKAKDYKSVDTSRLGIQ